MIPKRGTRAISEGLADWPQFSDCVISALLSPFSLLDFHFSAPYPCHMSKAELLQAKAATLPEPVAAEVLDFLDFVTAKRARERVSRVKAIHQVRGVFKGRLSTSAEFAERKSDEIRLEE